MRQTGIPGIIALAILVAAAGAAEARCADDLKALQARVDRAQKVNPSAQSAAAAKILQQLNDSPTADEVQCDNAVASARRALNAPPAEEAAPGMPPAAQPLSVQPVQPVETRQQPLNVPPGEEQPEPGK
jgi:hypothetical protein